MADARADAAIGAGVDVFHADALGEIDQTLGDELGVFDEIGVVADRRPAR